MKARRTSICRCGRPIPVGAWITQHGGRWLCVNCAIALATAGRLGLPERAESGP